MMTALFLLFLPRFRLFLKNRGCLVSAVRLGLLLLQVLREVKVHGFVVLRGGGRSGG